MSDTQNTTERAMKTKITYNPSEQSGPDYLEPGSSMTYSCGPDEAMRRLASMMLWGDEHDWRSDEVVAKWAAHSRMYGEPDVLSCLTVEEL
jgi:hypothetical protein